MNKQCPGSGTCAYQGGRNASFSENLAYVLNEWSLRMFVTIANHYTAWKVSVFGDFLVRIFPHLEWILRDKEGYSA